MEQVLAFPRSFQLFLPFSISLIPSFLPLPSLPLAIVQEEVLGILPWSSQRFQVLAPCQVALKRLTRYAFKLKKLSTPDYGENTCTLSMTMVQGQHESFLCTPDILSFLHILSSTSWLAAKSTRSS